MLGALVGLLSSVVPYSLEMVALRTLPPRVFGILMSLEPAAAALAAAVLLSEWLTPLQLLAMACVTAASGAPRAWSRPPRPSPATTPTRPNSRPSARSSQLCAGSARADVYSAGAPTAQVMTL